MKKNILMLNFIYVNICMSLRNSTFLTNYYWYYEYNIISAFNKFKFMISLFDTINNEDISDLNNFVFYDIGSISF